MKNKYNVPYVFIEQDGTIWIHTLQSGSLDDLIHFMKLGGAEFLGEL